MKNFDKIFGKRIFLEPLNHKNFSRDYVNWMQDEEVLQFLTGRTKAYSMEELEEYVTKMNESPTNYLFGIFLRAGNIHIGNIKIGGIDPSHRFADVGLLIGNKDMWGKGYATEAIGLVTQYAFNKLSLKKLTAGMVVENIGSYKAFIKAGYKEVGKLSGHVISNGKHVDTILFEKCR